MSDVGNVCFEMGSPAASSTLTASETVEAMRSIGVGTSRMRSPASSTISVLNDTMSDVGNVSFEMRSPSTSTASETVQIESKSETSKSRKRKRLHYFGDIRFEDISNPSKRKRSWSINKKTIASQRKKSIILKQREKIAEENSIPEIPC
ncbi:hypothetical protein JTB14_008703 [Gonioctena quinquepunctata]|nr:hypothetical protein JTB14_008703 [Gonioctena quinquepunctata]